MTEPTWLAIASKHLVELPKLNRYEHNDRPSDWSLEAARLVLQMLAEVNLEPTNIDDLEEGGVLLVFDDDQCIAEIECLNDGRILRVLYTYNGPDISNLRCIKEEIRSAVCDVLKFINRPTSPNVNPSPTK